MKATGIIRRIDELGRIVLPIELRRSLDISERDALVIFADENSRTLVLKKHEPSCTFCGVAEDLFVYKDKHICEECGRGINDSTS